MLSIYYSPWRFSTGCWQSLKSDSAVTQATRKPRVFVASALRFLHTSGSEAGVQMSPRTELCPISLLSKKESSATWCINGLTHLYSLGGIQLQTQALRFECLELNIPWIFIIVWLNRAYSKDLLMNQLDSGVKTYKIFGMKTITGVNTLSSYVVKLNQASRILSIKPNLELPVTCVEKS